MTPERILITGATGFAGKWLARELAQTLPDALLFGSSHHSTDATELPFGFVLLTGDLANADELAEVIGEAKPDAVFHLAGLASSYGSDRENIFRANVEGTETLLRLLSGSNHLCRVLLASTGYVYGPTQEDSPARESDVLHPLGDYAESKVEMERIARPFADIGNLSLTIVRAFNHTGPGQKPQFPHHRRDTGAKLLFLEDASRIEPGRHPRVGMTQPGGILLGRQNRQLKDRRRL